MFDALDETLRQLLIDDMPITDGEIDIAFDQPKREWSTRLSRPTINLFLYDIRENPELRQYGWNSEGNGRAANRKRKPFRVDCYYMLTTWATDPSDEHRLMARAMLALFRHPEISRNRLDEKIQNQPYDVRTRLASHDRLTNPAEVWSALDNEMRPSVSYLVTLTLDPWTAVSDTIVRSLNVDTNQARLDPDTNQAVRYQHDGVLAVIGGTIRQQDVPLANAEVAIKGTGITSVTDSQGRFRLRGIRLGEHTLMVQPPEGESIEKPITIPLDEDGYDFNL